MLISDARSLEKRLPRLLRVLRAHIRIACLAAMVLQMTVLVAMILFRIPEERFTSNNFCGVAVLLLICAVAAVRQAAHVAFNAALERNDAMFTADGNSPAVSISAACPLRALVVLHVQLTGLRRDTFCR
ncbi:hypothetical protein [Paraburkholderia guartelaensis]|uniref:hypothetical protein n=1 Tax=Paraburkholderia guartelaensis TaxID=2546446 RepID=UPI002AB7C8ED|nr:hypothetical protein [Paraburkholderia guartelaensis]